MWDISRYSRRWWGLCMNVVAEMGSTRQKDMVSGGASGREGNGE